VSVAGPAGLTRRERQVAELVVAGLLHKEVASRLAISENTVRNHMSAVYARTGCRSAVELAIWWHGWREFAERGTPAPAVDWEAVDVTPALAAALAREAERRLYRLPPHFCGGRRYLHAQGAIECLRQLLTGTSRRPEGMAE
jgi:DNA-binding CsgD family transcriptional regulator